MKIALVQQHATHNYKENLKRGVAVFQNGYYAALANRVGKEGTIHFAGESFVVDSNGEVIARAPKGKDFILYAECDLKKIEQSFAKKHFLKDRRPDFYHFLKLED